MINENNLEYILNFDCNKFTKNQIKLYTEKASSSLLSWTK